MQRHSLSYFSYLGNLVYKHTIVCTKPKLCLEKGTWSVP